MKHALDIQILSRQYAISEMILGKMKNRILISISDEAYSSMKIENRRHECLDLLTLEFLDIDERGYVDHDRRAPVLEDVQQALEFADRDLPLSVHCFAGVSRSSAMAYLCACKRCGDPKEAIKILDMTKHWPNSLVCELGGEILGKEVLDPINEYKESIRKKSRESF